MEIIFQKDKKGQNKQVESFTLINRLDDRLLWDQNPLLVEQADLREGQTFQSGGMPAAVMLTHLFPSCMHLICLWVCLPLDTHTQKPASGLGKKEPASFKRG